MTTLRYIVEIEVDEDDVLEEVIADAEDFFRNGSSVLTITATRLEGVTR